MGVDCYEDYNKVVNKNRQLEQNQDIFRRNKFIKKKPKRIK